MKRYLLAALALMSPILTWGCGDETETIAPEAMTTVDTIIAEAEDASAKDVAGSHIEGLWRTQALIEAPGGVSAWADLIWVVGMDAAWHVVSVFADEERTVPLVRWDIVRAYSMGGGSAVSDQATELDWTDLRASVTPYVDTPALLEIIGIDDCPVEVGVPFDSSDNCAAPFFPFRECTLMDFAELKNAQLTFGDPQATDRCVTRVSVYEAWSFERVASSPELRAILEDRPPGI